MALNIEQQTQQYWAICKAYNQHPDADGTITVSDAGKRLSRALERVGPERVLFRVISNLKEQLIFGDRKCPHIQHASPQVVSIQRTAN